MTRKLRVIFRIYLIIFMYYSSSGASTGHTPAHVPHPMQDDASISYFPSPCDIQDTGHSAAHAPHAIHLSVILYAITIFPPPLNFNENLRNTSLNFVKIFSAYTCIVSKIFSRLPCLARF